MKLKNMDTSDIWRELFIPVDWDARKCYNSVKIGVDKLDESIEEVAL